MRGKGENAAAPGAMAAFCAGICPYPGQNFKKNRIINIKIIDLPAELRYNNESENKTQRRYKMSDCPYAVSHEVENMYTVAKGPKHGPAPIPEEGNG